MRAFQASLFNRNAHTRVGESLLALLVAIAYGMVLASLPVDEFKDRANYLVYAQDSANILKGRIAAGWLPTLANEPLWLLLNGVLGAVFTPEGIVRLMILVPASAVAWCVLRTRPRDFGWLLLFLFLPQVIKNHVIHLRQGVAVAVFLLAWSMRPSGLRALLFLCTPLIHASFFFVLGLMALGVLASRLRLAADARILLFVLAGVSVGLLLSWVADFLGARQSETYLFNAADVSGLGFIFWLAILLLFFLQGSDYLRRHGLAVGAVIFYLVTYFQIEVTARIFESTLVVVLLAGLSLDSWRRPVFLFGVSAYGLLYWVARLEQHLFGFGA